MAVWKLQYLHQPPSGRRLTTYMNGFVRTQHETSRIPYVHEAATEGKQACYICRVQERWQQYCDATTNNETLGALQYDPDKLVVFTRVPAPSGYASPSPQAGGFKLIQSLLDRAHPSGRESGVKSSYPGSLQTCPVSAWQACMHAVGVGMSNEWHGMVRMYVR